MNKSELVAAVAEKLAGGDPDARRYVDAVFDTIVNQVATGDRVQILGFGTFDSVERAARVGHNPRSQETIQVAASVAPRFQAGQTFKAQVKQSLQPSAAATAGTVRKVGAAAAVVTAAVEAAAPASAPAGKKKAVTAKSTKPKTGKKPEATKAEPAAEKAEPAAKKAEKPVKVAVKTGPAKAKDTKAAPAEVKATKTSPAEAKSTKTSPTKAKATKTSPAEDKSTKAATKKSAKSGKPGRK